MADTAESVPSASKEETREAIRQQLGDLRREVAQLAACEAQLAAAAHRRELRRLAVDVAGPLAVALALLTAFGLANAAVVHGLSRAVPTWAAALIMAGVWIVVGAALALAIWARGEHGEGLPWWRVLTGGPEDALEEVRETRRRAEHALGETLQGLVPALSREAASVAVPMASAVAAGMATETAGSVVDAGDALVEGSDDLVESVTEDLPGGGIINQFWDVVLVPGRFGVRVATTVLRRPPPAG